MSAIVRSTAVHVAFAFLAMGGWALYANARHGVSAAVLPALVQGCLSGGITFVLKRALEAMLDRLGGAAAFILPPLTTAGAILVVLGTVHWLVATPEIARTVAVPWTVSTVYAFAYSATLALGQRRPAGVAGSSASDGTTP